MSRLSGANLRYVSERLPHLQKVLHDDPVAALDGAHVAIVSSADAGVLDAVVAVDPPVVLDLSGRLTPLEALAGYQGVGW
ncbi:MAG: GDP-mannose dehydrogenase, partial [Pseudonocardiales bacterium]|nr:GDP-mannose dehydrogenase [Pseudonocardiales bacterium]